MFTDIPPTKKPRKLTPKQQEKADRTRVNTRYGVRFNCVPVNMFALSPIFDAGMRALRDGGDDDAIDRAMVGAFRAYVPIATSSIPAGDVRACENAEEQPFGEPGETALAYAARQGWRVLACDHYGRATVDREGFRTVLFRDPAGPRLRAATVGPVTENTPTFPLARLSTRGAPGLLSRKPAAPRAGNRAPQRNTEHGS